MKRRIRLANFLIDSTVFFVLVLTTTFFLKNYVEKETIRLYAIIFYYLYYFLFELVVGQTIGKMITKTKVVNVNNQEHPTFMQVLLRTVSRLIPIDLVSYLFAGNGIHDYLSRTQLIKKQNDL